MEYRVGEFDVWVPPLPAATYAVSKPVAARSAAGRCGLSTVARRGAALRALRQRSRIRGARRARLVPIQQRRFTFHRSRLTTGERLDRTVQRQTTRRTAQLVALRLTAGSPRHVEDWRCDYDASRPHSATANSHQLSWLYSGPRPTNPKSHSDWTTNRVPLTGAAGGVSFLENRDTARVFSYLAR